MKENIDINERFVKDMEPHYHDPMIITSPPLSPSNRRKLDHFQNNNTIDYIWNGESLGLELQRSKIIQEKVKNTIWSGKNPSLGVTFAQDVASREIYVLRSTKNEIIPNQILSKIDNKSIRGYEFNTIMEKLKKNNENGISQELQFKGQPEKIFVRSVGDVLTIKGIDNSFELISVNNINLHFLNLKEISTFLQNITKPCQLTFKKTQDAIHLAELQRKEHLKKDEMLESEESKSTIFAALAVCAILIA